MNSKKFKELQMLMTQGNIEPVPKGWMTRHEVAVHINRSLVTADRLIYASLAKGLMKKAMIRRPTASGVRLVPYFSFQSAIVGSTRLGRKRQRKR